MTVGKADTTSLPFSKSTEEVFNVQNACHTQTPKYGAHYCPRSAFPYHSVIMHIEGPRYSPPRDVLGSSVWVILHETDINAKIEQ